MGEREAALDRLLREGYNDDAAQSALERGRRLRHLANGFEGELIDALEWVSAQNRILYESWRAASDAADELETVGANLAPRPKSAGRWRARQEEA